MYKNLIETHERCLIVLKAINLTSSWQFSVPLKIKVDNKKKKMSLSIRDFFSKCEIEGKEGCQGI